MLRHREGLPAGARQSRLRRRGARGGGHRGAGGAAGGDLAGEDPSPLEVLLAERVASLWVLVELLEALVCVFFSRHNDDRTSASYLLKMVKVQESANRRYLAAIKALDQVRKLRANTPGVQFNTQINLATIPVSEPARDLSE